MALKRKEAQNTPERESSFSVELIAEGQHDARLAYVADLGYQKREYKNEFKGHFQQYSLGLEMLGHTYKDQDGKEYPRIMWTKPFWVYTKMAEQGGEFTLYKVFEPTAAPETCPDWEAQLGKPCTVSIKHRAGKEGAVYDNIDALLAIPAKYQESVAEGQVTPEAGDGEQVVGALYGLAKYIYEHQVDLSAEVTAAEY